MSKLARRALDAWRWDLGDAVDDPGVLDRGLYTSLGMDSLGVIELIKALEETFGFWAEDDLVERLNANLGEREVTLRDLLTLVPT